jgi:hypothetical protein
MDALHDMKDENQCFQDMLIHNVLRLIVESTIVMGLAMKEWTWYMYVKSAKEERRRVGVSRGVGTEEVSMEVWSRENGGTSGGESSQTLAEQDIEMGRAEVGVSEGAGGEEGGEAVVDNNTA